MADEGTLTTAEETLPSTSEERSSDSGNTFPKGQSVYDALETSHDLHQQALRVKNADRSKAIADRSKAIKIMSKQLGDVLQVAKAEGWLRESESDGEDDTMATEATSGSGSVNEDNSGQTSSEVDSAATK